MDLSTLCRPDQRGQEAQPQTFHRRAPRHGNRSAGGNGPFDAS